MAGSVFANLTRATADFVALAGAARSAAGAIRMTGMAANSARGSINGLAASLTAIANIAKTSDGGGRGYSEDDKRKAVSDELAKIEQLFTAAGQQNINAAESNEVKRVFKEYREGKLSLEELKGFLQRILGSGGGFENMWGVNSTTGDALHQLDDAIKYFTTVENF